MGFFYFNNMKRFRRSDRVPLPTRISSSLKHKLDTKVHPNHQCFVCCFFVIIILLSIVTIMDWMSVTTQTTEELIRLQQVGLEAEEEWLPILTSGNIKAVNSFHKGLAQKFEIIFDTGHVCAGKPILPENQFSLAKYKK